MGMRAKPSSVITAAIGGKCSVLMIAARRKFSAVGHSPIPVCLFDRKAQNFQDEKCIFHLSTRRGELCSPVGKKRKQWLRANTVRPYHRIINTYRKTETAPVSAGAFLLRGLEACELIAVCFIAFVA